MDFYDEGDDLNDEVDPEEFLELVAGQHALSVHHSLPCHW